MYIGKIPHSYSVRLYKNLLDRRKVIAERIDDLHSIEKEGFLTSSFRPNKEKSNENNQKILRFLNDPSREAWDQIFKIQVTMDKTLWKIWSDYDEKAPKEVSTDESLIRKWPSFPGPEKITSSALSALHNERDDLISEKQEVDKVINVMNSLYPILVKKFKAQKSDLAINNPQI
jgi:hypothetical protein